MTDDTGTTVAIACQGNGSHTAFTAGFLCEILRSLPEGYEIGALSGTSAGAMCAALAWDGLRRADVEGAIDQLEGFWDDVVAETLLDRSANNATPLSSQLTAEVGPFGVSPYRHRGSVAAQSELRETIERYIRFDDNAPSSPPHLFVGAADIESSSLKVFVDGEAGAAALLASAAVPNISRAVETDRPGHWARLFSQNPPIRPFFSEVPPEKKPDEIWIVKIIPRMRERAPRMPDDIITRRIERAWSHSLEQELYTIQSINELIDQGVIDDERYRHIETQEVELNKLLSVQSKLDWNRDFLEELMIRGEATASMFLESLME